MPRVLCKTKHYQVAGQIRHIANQLAPGAPLPVVAELMRRLSVSHGTVMQALKRLAEEGVIVRPFGRQRYIIAPGNPRISYRICIMRPDFPSSELDTLVQQIYTAGNDAGWLFDYYFFKNWQCVDFDSIALSHDAVILLPPSEALSQDFINALEKPRRPVLVIEQHLSASNLLGVCVDDYKAGYLAAETFIRHGHKRIAFFKDQPAETTMTERLAGFRAALADYGIAWDDSLLLDSRLKSFEDPLAAGYKYLHAVFNAVGINFTAVFTAAFSGGASMLRALRERGISVPKDVAVLTYSGDNPLCEYMNPKLSSIDINVAEYGRIVCEVLGRSLKGEDLEARQTFLNPKVILRESI